MYVLRGSLWLLCGELTGNVQGWMEGDHLLHIIQAEMLAAWLRVVMTVSRRESCLLLMDHNWSIRGSKIPWGTGIREFPLTEMGKPAKA